MESSSAGAAGRDPGAGTFSPAGRPYRFVILFFISLLTFGSYFAYDSIGALAPTLIQELGLARETIGSLYSAYSLAAIFIVFFGGMLIDRLGPRKASLLFSVLVTLGAVIVAVADSTWMLYLGRFVFGAGSESLVVAQSAIIARWFKGKELALAFGISLTLSRLGTLFSFNTEQMIATYFHDYHVALWAAALLCGFSLLCNLVYNAMDTRGERALDLPRAGAGDKIVFADIAKFGSSYWYVVMLCVTFYGAIFPFTALSTDMFVTKWGYPAGASDSGGFLQQVFGSFLHMFDTAGGITSIVIFASMVCAPFAGGLLDRIGRRASMMVLGALILIPAHLAMGLTQWNPIPSMVLLGVAFVLVPAALWPSVPMVVEESRVGTAFGLLTAIQNVGLMVFPKASGYLIDRTGDYTATQILFASLGGAGLLFALLLLRSDRRHGGVLEAGRPAAAGG